MIRPPSCRGPNLMLLYFFISSGGYVHDEGDAMMESFNADVSDNIFENNKYGTRFSIECRGNAFS